MPNRELRPIRAVGRLSGLRARLVLLVALAVLPALALLLGHRVRPSLIGPTVVGVVVIGAAWVGADLLVLRRIRALAEATRRVAEGDLSARSARPHGAGELGELSRAFDEMARALQRRETEAEAARTELQRSLEALRHTDEQRRRLLAHLAQAQEQERARIASDIHDDSIQAMTAVGIRLEALRRRVAPDPELLGLLGELERSVADAIARLRHLVFELRPPVLDREGLVPALRTYLEQTARDGALAFELANRLEEEPPPEVRAALYRIAVEALSNVRKHSRARTVWVELQPSDGGVLIRIRDDGRGLGPEDGEPRAGHLGLTAMRERAELAGGWLRIESAPGEGTTVEYWLPVRREAPAGAGADRGAR